MFADTSGRESELAYRPDLQDLRRSFLETPLDFYQEFLKTHRHDRARTSELAATSTKVERMVEELRVLDNISLLWQMNDVHLPIDLADRIQMLNSRMGEFFSADFEIRWQL